jgi:hypothetical protein
LIGDFIEVNVESGFPYRQNLVEKVNAKKITPTHYGLVVHGGLGDPNEKGGYEHGI